MERIEIDFPVLLQTASVAIGLVSACFLGRGGFLLSPDTIAELASTKFDYNLDAIESLAGQAADTRAGTVLVVLSVLLQVWSLSPPESAHRRSVTRNAIILALALSLGTWIVAGLYSTVSTRRTVERTRDILSTRAHENAGVRNGGGQRSTRAWSRLAAARGSSARR